jgi:hypothetical protein
MSLSLTVAGIGFETIILRWSPASEAGRTDLLSRVPAVLKNPPAGHTPNECRSKPMSSSRPSICQARDSGPQRERCNDPCCPANGGNGAKGDEGPRATTHNFSPQAFGSQEAKRRRDPQNRRVAMEFTFGVATHEDASSQINFRPLQIRNRACPKSCPGPSPHPSAFPHAHSTIGLLAGILLPATHQLRPRSPQPGPCLESSTVGFRYPHYANPRHPHLVLSAPPQPSDKMRVENDPAPTGTGVYRPTP